MTEHRSLTIAIAGFGWWGQHMSRRLQGNTRLVVAAIIEPDDSRSDAIVDLGLQRYETLDQALGDGRIEAIVLTTPNTMHEAQVVHCASAGKHVFCEKPLGLTGDSARTSSGRLPASRCDTGYWSRAAL